MENQKKCSNKKHSDSNAVSYCQECNLYLCNKCTNYHIEYLDSHHNINLSDNNEEIFSGICQELNHKIKFQYYCKNHNILCCAACLCKMKGKGNGQHSDCEVCLIKEIKEEKKNKLKENIKYLEESSKNIIESINKLKEIYNKINESKEEIKLKVINIFTKIRNIINEREDKLLLELDNIYNNIYFKEDIIKKGDKIPNQIKIYLEKGKILEKEWDDNDDKLINIINNCINIENNIHKIIEINESVEKCKSKKINIKFLLEDEQIYDLEEKIKKFGEIYNEVTNELKFKFKPGNNYNISNNGLIATKNNGGDNWNCVIVGDKEIPKDKISKWKIKINKYKTKAKNNSDIMIGLGPKIIKGNIYDDCWSIFSSYKSKVELYMKNKNINYNNHNEDFKEGDIIEVNVDRIKGNLSFAINDINYGLACSTIPKDDPLYPTVILYEQGLIVEII